MFLTSLVLIQRVESALFPVWITDGWSEAADAQTKDARQASTPVCGSKPDVSNVAGGTGILSKVAVVWIKWCRPGTGMTSRVPSVSSPQHPPPLLDPPNPAQMLYKAKRHCLLTWLVSRYCLLALHGSTQFSLYWTSYLDVHWTQDYMLAEKCFNIKWQMTRWAVQWIIASRLHYLHKALHNSFRIFVFCYYCQVQT